MVEYSHRIVILGGGFAGLYTALKLRNFPWSIEHSPQITVVDQNDRFVFLPFLYELITQEMSEWEVAPAFQDLLAKTPIEFIQAKVQAIDPDLKQVSLDNGQILECDRLVLALGGETPLSSVVGAAEYAIPFRSLNDAQRVKNRLTELESSDRAVIHIAVVGAGPSGVELSCKLADRLGARGKIHLIDRNVGILKTGAAFNQDAAQKALSQRQVIFYPNTDVIKVDANTLTLQSSGLQSSGLQSSGLQSIPLQSVTAEASPESKELPTDLVLWTVGNTLPRVVQSLSIPKNALGQISIQRTLQVENYEHLYALGDLATLNDQELNTAPEIPKTAQAAFQQATYAAWNIWASLTGHKLLPFRYSHLGEMLTLGKEEAALVGGPARPGG